MTATPGPSAYVPSHDYTEGASAIDIDSALANNRRSRRDSQYNTIYGEDGEGAMFAGPGHSVNPSSVSKMSHLEPGRRSSEGWSRSRRRSQDSTSSGRHWLNRRLSKDSQLSRQSVEGGSGDGEEMNGEEDRLLYGGHSGLDRERRQRRKSLSSPPRATVFENLAHLFGRTGPTGSPGGGRPSISQRSSISADSRRSRHSDVGSDYALDTDDHGEERWGYSSGEEDSDESSPPINNMNDNVSLTASMECDSDPPSPTGISLPLLASDQIFGGEARLDMEVPFALLDPPPPGPPSRQTLYIPDEDCTIRFVGYETIPWRQWLWRICCLLTLGILGLLGHWFPHLWIRWIAREKGFKDAKNGFVVVEVGFAYILYGFVSLKGA